MKRSYISSDPEILGGTPVVAGTRVPVEIILYRLKEGYTLSDIHDMYRHISIDTLKKVMEEISLRLTSLTTNDKAFLQA